MGVFNFIETFFFISLGITFVLILLLVYHFKQRLNIIEQKNDTMFDIINNIVQEITTIKQVTTKLIHNPIQPVFLSKPIHLETIHEPLPTFNSTFDSTFDPTVVSNYNEFEYNKTDSESDESKSEETDSDESIDDSDEESDDELETQFNNEITTDKLEKIIVSDDETEIEKLDLDNQNIKIISLDLDSELIIDSLEETAPIETISQIVKLDAEILSKDSIMDSYNKMSSSELKAIIIQKGLSSDPDKMKKPKLLKILEKSI